MANCLAPLPRFIELIPFVLSIIQEDYRAIREQSLARLMDYSDRGRFIPDRQFHRRCLSRLVEKYRLGAAQFIPADLPFELPLPHSTTITEGFGKANSSILGPDLSWTEFEGDWEVIDNKAGGGDHARSRARAETDLASSDTYAQVDYITQGESAFYRAGSTVRCNSSDGNCYAAQGRPQIDDVQLVKVISSTETELDNTSHTFSLPSVVRAEISGSTLESIVGGTDVASITDTSITTGTRCGMGAFKTGGGAEVDDFEAADVGGAAGFVYSQAVIIG